MKKKFLSMALTGVMLLSMGSVAFAEDVPPAPKTYSTTVSYEAPNDEQWTVTVPASMVPGDTAQVKAEGQWAANRQLNVNVPENVTLKNSITQGNEKTLNITFDGIEQAGDNTQTVTVQKDITLDNITAALFGTWSGTFDYTVNMINVMPV